MSMLELSHKEANQDFTTKYQKEERSYSKSSTSYYPLVWMSADFSLPLNFKAFLALYS